ncbi:HEAT repeat-containing protein 3-like [Babylonia areolata]|uniref:HEAT repeat-containing protein 3-like n=1 Tax=Babylonia areolata TaxID=304850 RepID=UPI003FD1F671
MGKKKNKKFAAPRPQPTGALLVPTNSHLEDDEIPENSPSMITDVLDQLQSAEESTRECGCGTLAAIASQPGALPVLLKNNVVRILAPLVIDPSPCVRHRALGALRNMTVDGGLDVCHDMVLKDVLTPLIALFKQYGTNWEPEKSETKHTDTRLDTFNQAVHVLWNLCEASDVAVTVFNKENLLPLLLPCLEHSVYGYPLATAVAQCLETVTENNAAAVEVCRGDDVLPMLKRLADSADSSSQVLLFKAALMGVLMNVLGGELMSGSSLSSCVFTLAHILGISSPALIAAYATKKPQQNGVSQMDASGDATDHVHMLAEEECVPTDSDYNDLVNTLDAQRVCLELVTNMCCSPEEEWEEVDSSESGSSDEMAGDADMDQDMAADNNNFDPVCVSSEVHAAFVANNIMAKVSQLSLPLSAELEAVLKGRKWGKRISKKLGRLRTHALLCINNLMEAVPVEAVGGVEVLHHLWDTLAQQVKTTGQSVVKRGEPVPPPPPLPPHPQPSDPDLLEASTSAMRAVVQKLAHLHSPKFAQVTVSDVHFLVKLAEGASSSVQIHVMRIVATIASLLVKSDPTHAVVQEVGGCLVAAATHSTDLVVVAEALDSLFDVFADDATDPVAQSLQLTEKLRAITPQLKARVRVVQKKSLGENYITVSTARTNLLRFIKYKESQGKR